MGRYEESVEQFASARMLFGRSIGADSPLYGSACVPQLGLNLPLDPKEGLTKALMHAGRYAEGFDRLEETFLNQAACVMCVNFHAKAMRKQCESMSFILLGYIYIYI